MAICSKRGGTSAKTLWNMQPCREFFAAGDQFQVRCRDRARADRRDDIHCDRRDHRQQHRRGVEFPAQRTAPGEDGRQPAVNAPGDRAHQRRADRSAPERRQHVHRLLRPPQQEEGVHRAHDDVAHERADRRAVDADLVVADQRPVHCNLHQPADDHAQHGPELVARGLQHRGRHLRETDENGGDAEDRQQHRPGGVAGGVDDVHDRPREHGETDAHRHEHERRHAQARGRRAAGVLVLPLHDERRDRGDDADRERHDERAGEIVERLRLAVDAVEVLRVVVAERSGCLQAVEHELRVDEVDQTQHARAERDRDADAQQRQHDFARPVRHVRIGDDLLRVVPPLVDDHIDQRDEAAGRHAEDRAAGGHGQTLAEPREIPREHQAHHGFHQHVDHLRDGRGLHVALPLGKALVRRRQTHEEHCRADRPDALRGLHIVHHVGELGGEEVHDQAAQQPQNGEHAERRVEGAAHLHGPAQRVCLADHTAERHGQTRGGQREKHVIDIVGHHEVRVTLVAEDVPERDLVDRAEDLRDDHAHSEDGGAVQVVLLALRLLQTGPSFP